MPAASALRADRARRNRKVEAPRLQKKAVELCKDQRMRSRLQEKLDRYQKAVGGKP